MSPKHLDFFFINFYHDAEGTIKNVRCKYLFSSRYLSWNLVNFK